MWPYKGKLRDLLNKIHWNAEEANGEVFALPEDFWDDAADQPNMGGPSRG